MVIYHFCRPPPPSQQSESVELILIIGLALSKTCLTRYNLIYCAQEIKLNKSRINLDISILMVTWPLDIFDIELYIVFRNTVGTIGKLIRLLYES